MGLPVGAGVKPLPRERAKILQESVKDSGRRGGESEVDQRDIGCKAALMNAAATMTDTRVARQLDATAAAKRVGPFALATTVRRLGAMLLPDSAAGRTLAVGAGIDSLGTGMFFASFALYFVGIVGIAEAKVALATTVAGAVALLVPVPLGRLADQFGTAKVYVSLLVIRGAGYCCYAFISDFKGFLVLSVLLTAADRSCTPMQQGIVTTVIGDQGGTRAMASIRSVRNVGLTVGFLVAAGAFETAEPTVFTALFVVNGVSFFVAAVMVRRALSRTTAVVVPPAAAPGGTAASAPRVRSPFRDRWFMVFTVSNGILWLHDTVLLVLLPIWVIKHTAVPAGWVPVLLAVNTLLTAVLQVYVARFAEGVNASNRLLGFAGILLMVCCGLLAIGQVTNAPLAVVAVLAAVVALSIAENLHAVATWELSAELSPRAALGRYLGAFSLAFTGQKVVGPALLVVVMMPAGLIGWPVLAGAFGTAALVSQTAARRCMAEREAKTRRPAYRSTFLSRVLVPAPASA